jgi:hypothetical protein
MEVEVARRHLPHRFCLVAVLMLLCPRGDATPALQSQAKKLGLVGATNCQYCHATCDSIEVMKQKARALGVRDGDCVVCHGRNVPSKLNERGRWLVSEKSKRGAKDFDLIWLDDYIEPPPPSAKRSASKPQKP